MEELKKKGLRAYFSLKNLVDINELSINSILKLFDALILPVVSYACQIWFYKTAFVNQVSSGNFENKPCESIKKIVLDPIERLHIKFLKWTLGVHKKTSNVFCWGDTGRTPLLQKISKQATDYFERLEIMNVTKKDCLVRHAFAEQKALILPWYQSMSKIINISKSATEDHGNHTPSQGLLVKDELGKRFEQMWTKVAEASPKLRFYFAVKKKPGFETYLKIKNRQIRKSIARLRSSSHRLNIETARYSNTTQRASMSPSTPGNIAWKQCCKVCCSEDTELLLQQPFAGPPLIEDEQHVLATCPAYHHLRLQLCDHVKSAVLAWDERLVTLFEEPYILEFGTFINRIFRIRFPKTKARIKKDITTRT